MQFLALIHKLLLLTIGLSLTSIVCDANATKLKALERRQQLYPSNLKVKYVLARAYANRGKADPRFYDKSINKLQEILKIKQIAVVKFYLGLMHARQGNLNRAINQWTTIVRSLKPNNLTTLRYLALVHEKKGEFPQSLKYWNKVLSIAPANYKAHYHAALVTLKTLSIEKNLRYSNAIRHFKKVLARYPEHKKTLWYLNLTYKGSKQYLNQRKVLNQLLVYAPKNPRLRREYKLNVKNLKAQPVDAVLKVPKPKSETLDVSVSTEITEDEFNAVFSKDPEPQEVPEVHEPEPVHKNPTLPIDSPLSADAELLFNQGVQYMQNKEYDLALFNFLQAQELDPKFAQCYMQIGEVYLKLADATPTEEKFLEHLQLAEQALETAVQLEPDSLLAHASRAKQKEIQEKRNLGFEKTHLKVAKRAIESGDVRYAVEEYIILMTNNFVSSELIFSLSAIYDRVDEGVKLDLNNVLLSAASEGKLGAIYLESKFKVDVDEDRTFDLIDRMFLENVDQPNFFKSLKIHLEQNQGDKLDDFIMGRYLLNAQSYGPASKWLQSAVKKSNRDSLKKRIEPYLSKALKGSKMRLNPGSYMAGIKLHKSSFELYEREKNEIISAQPSFKSIFELDSKLGLLEDKRQLLISWTIENPTNMLGKYILGLILEKSSLEESQQKAVNYKTESVTAHKNDSDWHFKLGLLALRLGDLQWAERFIEQSEFIILKRGWEIYNPYALHASKLANKALLNDNLDLARGYIKFGFRFHPYSRDLATVESNLIEQAGAGGVIQYSQDFFMKLMSIPVYNEVFWADMGLNIFWAVFLVLLFFSALIVVKNQAELKHLVDELFGQRSYSIPIMTFLVGFLLILFPTGLVLFLPIILWTFMDDFEQIVFVLGILLLIFLPFVFKVGYVNNTEQIAAWAKMQEGNFEEVKKDYNKRLKRNPMDVDARFQLALIQMNTETSMKLAIQGFQQVLEEEPDHFAALNNLGICHARQGSLDAALPYLTKALNLNPIHDKVLYNLSRVYELKGEMKSASNYLGWIGRQDQSAYGGVDRYLKHTKKSEAIYAPIFLQEGLDRHNTFFSGVYESKFSANLLLFLAWFLMGGGIIGVLLFLRDKMDIFITSCRFCDAKICGNCQSILNGDPLCSSCFESPIRRKKGLINFKKERMEAMWSQVQKWNFILPGFAQVYCGKLLLGILLAFFFWFALITWWSNLGYLWNSIFFYQNSFTSAIEWLFFLLAVVMYSISCGFSITHIPRGS